MTEQVPSKDRAMPERREVKRVLRELGMSTRQVDALLRGGWARLVGDTEAENAELRDALAALTSRLETSS